MKPVAGSSSAVRSACQRDGPPKPSLMLPEPSITNSTVGLEHEESVLIGVLLLLAITVCVGFASALVPADAAPVPAGALVALLREDSLEPGAPGSAPQCKAAHAPTIRAARTRCG